MFGMGVNIEKCLKANKGDKVEKAFNKADKAKKLTMIAEMGQCNRDQSSAILCTIIKSGDEDIRLAAVKALGQVGFSPAITHLRRLIGEEQNQEIKAAAVDALEKLQQKYHNVL